MRSGVIWAETAFPDVRVFVDAVQPGVEGSFLLRVDTGFGNPMEPLPQSVEYPIDEGPRAGVLVCRHETLFAEGARPFRAWLRELPSEEPR